MRNSVTFLLRFFIIIMLSFTVFSCKKDGLLSSEESITAKSEEIPNDCGEYNWYRCPDTTGFNYYLTGVRLLPLEKDTAGNKTYYYYCRVLRNQIIFEVNAEYRRYNQSSGSIRKMDDPIIGKIVNPVQMGKSSFSFNKDIYYRGTLIKANENILGHKEITYPDFLFGDVVSPFAIMQIHMNKSAFEIKKGLYTITASYVTADDKTIKASLDVYFDLNQ